MTFSFPRILFSLFPQGIKLEEQKPGPQKNKVGCVDEVAARWARQGDGRRAGLCGLSFAFHQELLKWMCPPVFTGAQWTIGRPCLMPLGRP